MQKFPHVLGEEHFIKFWRIILCLVLSTLLSIAFLALSHSLICLECEYSLVNDLDTGCLRGVGRGFPAVSVTTISLTVLSPLTSTWYCDLFLFLDLWSSFLFKCSTLHWSLSNFLFNSILQILTDNYAWSVWDWDVTKNLSFFFPKNLEGRSQVQKAPNAITEILSDTLEKN